MWLPGRSVCMEDGSTQFTDPPTARRLLSLSPRVPREHWWASAQCCQPLSLKGIIVFSCGSSLNQWDALFPVQHVGHGAPDPADVSGLWPAECEPGSTCICVCGKVMSEPGGEGLCQMI